MEYPTIIHLRFKGCWWYVSFFLINFNRARAFCVQTVDTLIRRRISGSALFAYVSQKKIY